MIMSAPKSFQMNAKRAADKTEYAPQTYRLVDADGNERDVVLHYPGDGSFGQLIAATGPDTDEQDAMSSLYAFMGEAFSDEDNRFVRSKLRSEELTYELVFDLVKDAMEVWSTFPTKSSSASSTSRPRTGTRSTGRSRGVGSIQHD